MKKGDVVRITDGILRGQLGHIVRRSRRTGGLTVHLWTDCGAYKAGSEVNIAQHECTTVGLPAGGRPPPSTHP